MPIFRNFLGFRRRVHDSSSQLSAALFAARNTLADCEYVLIEFGDPGHMLDEVTDVKTLVDEAIKTAGWRETQ